jgi:hypothetical protein
LPIQVQEASRTQNRLDQNRTTPRHIIIKTPSIETTERLLKAVKEKKQITYNGKSIKITAYFSMETLKARRTRNEVFWALNENNFNTRILYPASIIQNRWSNTNLPNKQKLKQYMTTKPLLQKIIQGILHIEDERKQNNERMGSIKPQKKRQAIRE